MVEYFYLLWRGGSGGGAAVGGYYHRWNPACPCYQYGRHLSGGATAGGRGLCIVLDGLFSRVRWNNKNLEHRTAFGRETRTAWSDVRAVRPNWRCITIATRHDGKVTFSQFHVGAAQLAIHATNRARRNAETAAQAFATL
ncbi:MAG: hypothetical protein MO852_11000 [Candidatus Devosia euplotis]|nr:hypothetical protein [Candidatus Devosia euplotis]